ncbi:MAG: SUF system NifU family Fe-S cluster assembly protein [Phycisphaerae bacterium]|nr:SUF system NifU family Fe-S cluster assembly protein [Phycisphaerae bacterium]NIX30129.1 SUF system NifU family Fe-S cluster assembly protein [Phycisphaerae bacterium]
MDDFYRENILEHYRNPSFKGTLPKPTHSHQESNPVCGDQIRIDLRVNEDDIIEEVAFSGHGCAISQASASMLMEMIQGKPLSEVKKLSKEDILAALGIEIGPVRMKCALLALKVFKACAYNLSAAELEEIEDEVNW